MAEPQKYVGLYVYDFGDHVAVGYTAAEVRILRETEAHRDGTAYEIYRVSEEGAIELRGVHDERLTTREAVCFLRATASAARRDYEAIRAAADRDPVPTDVETQLGTLQGFDPPHVTGVSYPTSAATVMARWLSVHVADAGDQVVGGTDVHGTLMSSAGERHAVCRLRTLIDYVDRSEREVLSAIHEPLQR